MSITVNLRYTGTDGNAVKFAEEMISGGMTPTPGGSDGDEG